MAEGTSTQYRQGVVEAWDPDTGDNTIRVAGGVLLNLPTLTGEAATLVVGDVVALLSAGDRWFVLGKVTTPGDPGTVPSWTADLTALEPLVDLAAVTTGTTVTGATLAEGAVDQGVITGAVIQTSVSGTRVVLGSDDPVHTEWKDQILMYTGHADSPDPAEFQASGHANFAQLLISGPPLPTLVNPALNLYSDAVADDAGIVAYGYTFKAEDPDGGLVTMTGGGIAADGPITTGGDTVATDGPFYYAYLNASQPISHNVATKVTGWVADGASNSSGITYSAGNFTVPKTGRYRLRAQGWWGLIAAPAGFRTLQWIRVTPNTGLVSDTTPPSAASATPNYAEKTVRLAVGEQVFVQAVQTQGVGTTVNLVGSNPDISYAQIEWVGP
jgi:hypothetical protein